MAYDIGDTPRFEARFTDIDGDPADPTTMRFRVKSPAGSTDYDQDAPEVTNPQVGTWMLDLGDPYDIAGYWIIRAEGLTGLVAAEEVRIAVRESAFTT